MFGIGYSKKYFIIFEDGIENREWTKDAAIRLGIIEDEDVKKEAKVDHFIIEETNEKTKW